MDASGIATAHGAHVIIKEGFEPDEYDNALADKLAAFMPGAPRSWCAVPTSRTRTEPPRAASTTACARTASSTTTATARSSTATWTSWRASTWNASASLLEAPPQPSRSRSLRSRKRPRTLAAPTAALWTTCACADAPGLGGTEVAHYSSGETVTLDNWYKIADGYVWGRYTGYSGATRYIAVGKATGKPEADDYLVKVG